MFNTHTHRAADLPGDVVHEHEGHGPLVVPGHLAGAGLGTRHLGPQRLRPGHVRLVPCSLGEPGGGPDQLVTVAAPRLVEAAGRDSVRVLS